MRRFLKSKEKEIFVVGGQAHNSSAVGAAIDDACKAIKRMNGNTLLVPIYWEQIEPIEGQFKWEQVTLIYQKAETYGLYLILLWFGTWKNGTSKYAPEWVKCNKKRFWRVQSETGVEIPVLSPHCQETKEADASAFAKLMKCVEELDREKERILAVQIENEPGIMNGPRRDYSHRVNPIYYKQIPCVIKNMLQGKEATRIRECWMENGSQLGNWQETFGNRGEELFTAYETASYVNFVAKQGRKVSAKIFYTNAWVENHRLKLAGLDYPSGGPVEFTLDLWKYVADELCFISPDNYQQTYDGYMKCCAAYNRKDNPLFISESGLLEWNSRFMFAAVADHLAIGMSVFGVESILEGEEFGERETSVAQSMQILGAMAGALVKYSERKIYAIMQEEYAQYQYIEFENYIGIAYFTNCHSLIGRSGTDWNWHDYHHKNYSHRQKQSDSRGRGMIMEISSEEFYVAGDGFQLIFVPINRNGVQHYLPGDDFHLSRSLDFFSIEEGVFDENGEFIASNRRNGDEVDFGIWVEPDNPVVRVRLCPYKQSVDKENKNYD